jgi:hypothetical protein
VECIFYFANFAFTGGQRVGVSESGMEVGECIGQQLELRAAEIKAGLEFWRNGSVAKFFGGALHFGGEIVGVSLGVCSSGVILLNIFNEEFRLGGEGCSGGQLRLEIVARQPLLVRTAGEQQNHRERDNSLGRWHTSKMQECSQMFVDGLLIGHWVGPGFGEFGGVRAQKF